MADPAAPSARWQRLASIVGLLVVVLAFGLVLTVVDLSPQVESDFFFSSEDPQLRGSQEIAAQFPSRDQLLVAAAVPDGAAADLASPEYLAKIKALTTDLVAIPGIETVQSVTRGPSSPQVVAKSPVWSRILLGRDPAMTLLVASFRDDADRSETVAAVEAAMATHQSAEFQLDASGVPFVVEHIRRALARDLRVFSLVALLAFGALIAFVYRSAAIFAGSLLACLGSCATTLAVLWACGSPIGLLTANIVTIVFVLCLSHVVFLTANTRYELAAAAPEEREAAVRRAVGITWQASVWCMATTLLGFASLFFSSAKPLRELGFAGSVGTLVAILVPYALYPPFLTFLARRGGLGKQGGRPPRPLPGRPAVVYTVVALVLALLCLPLLPRLDTDPNLLSYFSPSGSLYRGLERIDRHGGSSPLLLVVSDPGGERLDGGDRPARLATLAAALEKDAEVGSALGLPVLLAEARLNPLAGFLAPAQIVDLLMGPNFGQVARSFLSEDRKQALFLLRLFEGEHGEGEYGEAERGATRHEVIARLEAEVGKAGLRLERKGGLYDLQASLGELVARSLIEGLGGLLLLFLPIAFIVARSSRGMFSMILCLTLVPVLLLGFFSAMSWPLDIISSPAANVAIGMGIDSMIHLLMAVRRRRLLGDGSAAAWAHARTRLGPAILGGAGILAAGFGLFVFSSFPPTVRFGLGVAIGTLTAAAIALWVLPIVAGAEKAAKAP